MEGNSMNMPIMIGLFKFGSRSNLGNYNGTLNKEDVRQKFFDIWKSELKLCENKNWNNAGRLGTSSNWMGKPDGESNNFIKPFDNPSKKEFFQKINFFNKYFVKENF